MLSHQAALTILILCSSTAFAFLWVNSPLSPYRLQLIAFLLIFIVVFFRKKKGAIFRKTLISLTVFNMAALLLISQNGDLNSPLFFLIYFLLLGLGFLTTPLVTLITTLSLFLFFLPFSSNQNDWLKLASLFLITPLSLILSQQRREMEQQEKTNLTLKEKKKIAEQELSLQETTSLLWLSLTLKNNLIELTELLNEALSDVAHLSPHQKEILEKAYRKSKQLLKESQKVKSLIDQQTD
ncbi:hypothetical protein KBI33_03880 [Candidatus Shapirobacteria bacterium]|nr:hypothetical protein [Candidatus Shapirobacteria bacterium]